MIRDVQRGLVWSSASNLVLRLGSVLLGIALARLLTPKAFGVFAVGLTVQTILMTLNDLGLSGDLLWRSDSARRAPTVATLSAAGGAVLTAGMALTAKPLASALGAPQAAGVVRVLALTIVVSSVGVVPYTHLTRHFQQGRLFTGSALEFVVSTGGTLGFVFLGMGPMALALGRLIGQVTATTSQFVLAHLRPSFGFDRAIARSALAYGLPLMATNLLGYLLLNVDNMTIGRIAGATSLGFYVLAFNISTWPMSTIGTAVRAVSLPGFARVSHEDRGRSLCNALSLTWAVALPVAVLLGALAHQVVVLFYGTRWGASAVVLGALALFGGMRVAFDLFGAYLMARGASRPVLYVQLLWFFGLIPPMILATRWRGIAGAGWTHLVVAALIILPAYLLALTRVGVRFRSALSALLLPTLAAAPTWWVAHTVASQIQRPILALLLGGAAGSVVYVAICHRWILRLRALLTGRDRAPKSRLPEQAVLGEPAI